ncbi:MAG: hypothetical protein AB1553_01880 [Nitrospirota bacterium]
MKGTEENTQKGNHDPKMVSFELREVGDVEIILLPAKEWKLVSSDQDLIVLSRGRG